MPPRTRPTAPNSRRVISRQLRAVIRARGMTAYALGRRADIDPGIIQRFLNEERDIKLDTLDRLADVLGLRLAEGSRGRGRPAARAKAGQATEAPPEAPSAEMPSPPDPGEPPTADPAEPPEVGFEAEGDGPPAEVAPVHWWES